MVPSGMVTWKQPSPCMATSSWLPDCCRLPCEKVRLVATVRTPRPICRPVGSVDCSVTEEPTWRRFWYIRSSKTACDFLKPLVDTLARLFEITSSCICWASMPVLEIHRELIMAVAFQGLALQSEQLPGRAVVGFSGLQQAHLRFELARGLDHADHLFDRVHVGAFER